MLQECSVMHTAHVRHTDSAQGVAFISIVMQSAGIIMSNFLRYFQCRFSSTDSHAPWSALTSPCKPHVTMGQGSPCTHHLGDTALNLVGGDVVLGRQGLQLNSVEQQLLVPGHGVRHHLESSNNLLQASWQFRHLCSAAYLQILAGTGLQC